MMIDIPKMENLKQAFVNLITTSEFIISSQLQRLIQSLHSNMNGCKHFMAPAKDIKTQSIPLLTNFSSQVVFTTWPPRISSSLALAVQVSSFSGNFQPNWPILTTPLSSSNPGSLSFTCRVPFAWSSHRKADTRISQSWHTPRTLPRPMYALYTQRSPRLLIAEATADKCC